MIYIFINVSPKDSVLINGEDFARKTITPEYFYLTADRLESENIYLTSLNSQNKKEIQNLADITSTKFLNDEQNILLQPDSLIFVKTLAPNSAVCN